METIQKKSKKEIYPKINFYKVRESDSDRYLKSTSLDYIIQQKSENENENPLILVLIDEIFKFKDLKYNWDSYNANEISLNCISIAIDIITLLETNGYLIERVFPMRDGGIQLEKRINDLDIEFEISPEEKITLLAFDSNNNLIKEQTYTLNEIDNLIEFLDEQP